MAIIAGVAFQGLVGGGVIEPTNLLAAFLFLTILLNLFLMLFNIIPVHPLDGSKLSFALFDHTQVPRVTRSWPPAGREILFVAVLVSAFTSLNIFFYLRASLRDL